MTALTAHDFPLKTTSPLKKKGKTIKTAYNLIAVQIKSKVHVVFFINQIMFISDSTKLPAELVKGFYCLYSSVLFWLH